MGGGIDDRTDTLHFCELHRTLIYQIKSINNELQYFQRQNVGLTRNV